MPERSDGDRRLSDATKRLLMVLGGVALAALIVWGFLEGRGEMAREREREAPIAAASRVRPVGPQSDQAAIVLDVSTEERVGIATRVLGASSSAGSVRLTGELVADPARITTIRAAVPGRLAAASGHWPALGERVAAGTVVGQVSDARPLETPRAGTVTRVSAQPGELVQAGQELLQLTDFGEPLARVVWRPDTPLAPPPTVTIAPLSGASVGTLARLVGPAADVDTLTRAPVYLYRLTGAWPGARPGTPVVATIADPRTSATGVLVPTEAVVQWEGLAWAYVRRARGQNGAQYLRARVDTSHPVDGGYLVNASPAFPLAAGDTVVVRGAQQLLSEEFRARVTVGDEGGKR